MSAIYRALYIADISWPLSPRRREYPSIHAIEGYAMGEKPCSSQPTATTCVLWSCRLKGCFTPPLCPTAYHAGEANKAETAFHGCHCRGDMVVRMPKVLARPWVGVQCFN